jgi:hypothetical protein
MERIQEDDLGYIFTILRSDYGRHAPRHFRGRSQWSGAAKVLRFCLISRRYRLFSAQKKDVYATVQKVFISKCERASEL